MEIKQQLLAAAVKVKECAYVPYSKYKVGAAIYTPSNKIYTGCNVENISFPCGTCAEAGAIAAMVAGKETKIKAILITSSGADLVYPCGACLQRIAEFADEETTIYLADAEKICREYSLAELLPHNFSTKELRND